jgi:hypothetical protein
VSLLRAILQHRPQVLALLDPANNPFPHTPPASVRTRLVAFDFVPDGALQSEAAAEHVPISTPHWETTPLPRSGGKWDTSSLCLEMSL